MAVASSLIAENMTQDDRFSSLKQDTNPFREQSRRHRNRSSNQDQGRRHSQRTRENNNDSSNRMTEAFGSYIEQQLGSQLPTRTNAYLPPSRARLASEPVNSFRSGSTRQNLTTDFTDSSSFPELKSVDSVAVSNKEKQSGWQTNGVDMVSKTTQSSQEETESDEVKPGWVRLSSGKITYGPPSTHYERMIYHMLQARNAALNDLRRRQEQYKQYDYEMYGDRMLYEDRLGGFSEDEDDEEESSTGDSGNSSYESDNNDGTYDDWY